MYVRITHHRDSLSNKLCILNITNTCIRRLYCNIVYMFLFINDLDSLSELNNSLVKIITMTCIYLNIVYINLSKPDKATCLLMLLLDNFLLHELYTHYALYVVTTICTCYSVTVCYEMLLLY